MEIVARQPQNVVWSPSEAREENDQCLLGQVLTNPLILARLAAAFEEIGDLKRFRLVCRLWYLVSLEQWHSQATICLRGATDEVMKQTCYVEEHVFENGLAMPSMTVMDLQVATRESRQLFGVQKVHFYSRVKFRYGKPVSVNDKVPLNQDLNALLFWKEYGPAIKSLTLEMTFTSPALIDWIIHEAAPNLETLALTHAWNIGPEAPPRGYSNLRHLILQGVCSFDMAALVKQCPTLEALTVHLFCETRFIQDYGEIFENEDTAMFQRQQWAAFGCRNRSNDYRDLRFSSSSYYQALGVINAPRLKELNMHLDKGVSQRAATALLTKFSQSGTLERLSIFRYPIKNIDPFPNLFQGPNMRFDKLVQLTLKGTVVTDLDFLAKMPSLKSLLIDGLSYDQVPFVTYDPKRGCHPFHYQYWYPCRLYLDPIHIRRLFKDPKKFYKPASWKPLTASKLLESHSSFALIGLERLEIDFGFKADSLEVLHRWAPNLKTLATILDNDGLAFVCQSWKHLSCLRLLLGSRVDDEGITGLAKDDKDLRKSNLTDLKYLQKFELEAFCGQGLLTDEAAEKTFLQMPLLDTLRICCSEMSSCVVKKLCLKIRNAVILQNSEHANLSCEVQWRKVCKQGKFLQALEESVTQ